MKEILTRIELFRKEEDKLNVHLRKHNYNVFERMTFLHGVYEGIALANTYPDWIPYSEKQPKNGDKVVCYLDDDTIATYTYHNNNKELAHLFKNHVIAWMYQPPKPIFKDE